VSGSFKAFANAGEINTRRRGHILWVRMPVSDEMQPRVEKAANLVLLGWLVRSKSEPRPEIATRRLRCNLDVRVRAFKSSKQLAARLSLPEATLSILIENCPCLGLKNDGRAAVTIDKREG
jgi:hypothetical protein